MNQENTNNAEQKLELSDVLKLIYDNHLMNLSIYF